MRPHSTCSMVSASHAAKALPVLPSVAGHVHWCSLFCRRLKCVNAVSATGLRDGPGLSSWHAAWCIPGWPVA